jgi:hypothetical protein
VIVYNMGNKIDWQVRLVCYFYATSKVIFTSIFETLPKDNTAMNHAFQLSWWCSTSPWRSWRTYRFRSW